MPLSAIAQEQAVTLPPLPPAELAHELVRQLYLHYTSTEQEAFHRGMLETLAQLRPDSDQLDMDHPRETEQSEQLEDALQEIEALEEKLRSVNEDFDRQQDKDEAHLEDVLAEHKEEVSGLQGLIDELNSRLGHDRVP